MSRYRLNISHDDKAERWFWRVLDEQGNIRAKSEGDFDNRIDAIVSAERYRRKVHGDEMISDISVYENFR